MSERHRFTTLDGMRGVAASAIFIRHSSDFFGFNFRESFLAVDFFFVLSGFVLAQAYGERLKNDLSGMDFFKIRLARFYPLYLLGTLFGILSLGFYVFGMHGDFRKSYAWSILLGLIFLPTLGVGKLFPFDNPAWSLFFELMVNALYGFVHRYLRLERLLCAAAVSAFCLCGVLATAKNLDIGYTGDRFSLFASLSRVVFSFTMGLILFEIPSRSIPRLPSFLVISALAVLLCAPVAGAYRPIYDFLFVLFFSPLLVSLGSVAESDHHFVRNAFITLGVVSYPIYILQQPAVDLLRMILDFLFLRNKVAVFAPWDGLVLSNGFFFAAVWLDKNYDRPLRRWLKNSLDKKTA